MKPIDLVLGIETSCDDTSIGLVERNGFVRAVVSANQDSVHQPFGGIVPEIASRNHTLQVLPLVDECLRQAGCMWEDVDGLAVTNRPGLLGSLLVGVVTAKTLALSLDLPFLGVNHLEAHLIAPFLRDTQFTPPAQFQFPYVALAVSGGHTQLYIAHALGRYEVLGRTLDDAAGEAFDKFAKMIGLGFPGGVAVDRLALGGDAKAFEFPRALATQNNMDFSFSGLKAAALRQLEKMTADEVESQKAALCASFQQAIVDSLLNKLDLAVRTAGLKTVVITGGVSANSQLRAQATEWASRKGLTLVIPPPRYCTDNGAMVALLGAMRMNRGEVSSQTMGPLARMEPQEFGGGI